MTLSPPDPSNLDFERRILVREDVGRAFQQFVWEALSSTEFPDLVQHPVRGRDGGIDLIDQGDGRRTALECKFHSDARDDGPESDWRRVASVLKETLPELCGKEEAKVLTSPHAPWLDRQRAITAYWFCISTTFANESAVDRLKGEIERDFEAISKLHPRLDHLARIVVQVRAGQHFASVLARRRTLRYRWFGRLPAGLTAVDAYASASARTFRKFLDAASLPYFSFAEFARESGIPTGGLHPDPGTCFSPSSAKARGRRWSSGGRAGSARRALRWRSHAPPSGKACSPSPGDSGPTIVPSRSSRGPI